MRYYVSSTFNKIACFSSTDISNSGLLHNKGASGRESEVICCPSKVSSCIMLVHRLLCESSVKFREANIQCSLYFIFYLYNILIVFLCVFSYFLFFLFISSFSLFFIFFAFRVDPAARRPQSAARPSVFGTPTYIEQHSVALIFEYTRHEAFLNKEIY